VSPTDGLTRAEFEARMEQIQKGLRMELAEIRAETKLAQDHQDEEWNKGIRALREDLRIGSESLRDDIREMFKEYVRHDVFVARLTPVQMISYSIVALIATMLVGLLGIALSH